MTLTVLASDGSQDTQTITRAEYDRLRGEGHDVHVVRHQVSTGGDE